MEKQEYIIRLNIMQEEVIQIEKQIGIMDQQAGELLQISKSLEDLGKKENPEFLANLGKGIFAKVKSLEKELFVSIGKGIVIKKSPKEAIEIMTTQLRKASEIKSDFMSRINELQIEMQKLTEEAEKTDKKTEKKKRL